MKLLNGWAALALAGALAACSTVERTVQRQVMVIPPPDEMPAPAATPVPPAPAVTFPTAPAALPPPPDVVPPPADAAAPAAAPPAAAPAAAAPPAAPPSARAPAPIDVIRFKPDAYKFEPSYRPVLDAHAQKLKGDPNLHLVIQAWTDPRGAQDYNLALSKKRAETVARYLVAHGVPQEQLELVYHGERRPRDGGEQRAGEDRRVELQYRIP